MFSVGEHELKKMIFDSDFYVSLFLVRVAPGPAERNHALLLQDGVEVGEGLAELHAWVANKDWS